VVKDEESIRTVNSLRINKTIKSGAKWRENDMWPKSYILWKTWL